MAWSSKSVGSSFQHDIFRLLVRCGLIGAARLLLGPVSFWYAVRPSIRKRYSSYLKHRFGDISEWDAFFYTARAYRNFADVLLDRAVLGITGKFPVRQNEETITLIGDVLSEGCGCLLVSAHFGSWQVALSGLEVLGRPISLVQWQSEEDIDRHYFSQGDGHQISVINPRRGLPAMVEMTSALNRNELVCTMADRFASYEREYVETDFLGGRIRIPSAPWIIASMAGCPIVYTFSMREDGIVTGLSPVLVRVPAGLRRKPDELKQLIRIYVQRIEELVAENPLHFFNFYDMWIPDNDER